MFLDARSVESGATIKTEVCIIGGGVAGLTIAASYRPKDSLVRDRKWRFRTRRGNTRPVPGRMRRDALLLRRWLVAAATWAEAVTAGVAGVVLWIRLITNVVAGLQTAAGHSGRRNWRRNYERALPVLQLGSNNFDVGYWTKAIDRPDVKDIPFPVKRWLTAYRNSVRLYGPARFSARNCRTHPSSVFCFTQMSPTLARTQTR